MDRYRLANLNRHQSGVRAIEDCCRKTGIKAQVPAGGSRQRNVSRARSEVACRPTYFLDNWVDSNVKKLT